jgi:hypothetical protein
MSDGDRSAAIRVPIEEAGRGREPARSRRRRREPEHPPGHDYEYDEAHDVPAGPLGETPAPHRVDPPVVNLGAGGDYGYDEAHDFGAT